MESFFDIIRVPFGYLMEWFYNFTSNYGLALILFGILIKLVLLWPSAKSKKTMMKQARLQPRIKEIEIACGDDKQKYQQEVQALYKEEGVSMFGGCLWSLLPLFILIPLYQVIREPLRFIMHYSSANVSIMKEAFGAINGVDVAKLPYWQMSAAQNMEQFRDVLTQAGVAVKESMNFKLFGIDLGVLVNQNIKDLNETGKAFGGVGPWLKTVFTTWKAGGGALIIVLSGVFNYLSMFLTQKFNSSVTTNAKGERDASAAAADQSSKMMTYMMPLMSVWFGFIMPLGMSVYWIVQSIFGIAQDYILTKHYRKVYDAEDAVKREKAAQRAAEEAEKERIRAAKRAANPDGIDEYTSKKKQQKREKQSRETAAKNYEAKKIAEKTGVEPDVVSGDATRPYARGRAYSEDHYGQNAAQEESADE